MAYIYKNPHEQSYLAAQEEINKLESERLEVNKRLQWIGHRLEQLNAYIQAITPLIEDDPGIALAEAGLTAACRDLLTKNGRWVTAGEMRALLYSVGIDLQPYTNPMAVLHSVLGRVGQKQRASNGTLYYGPIGTAFSEADVFPNNVPEVPERRGKVTLKYPKAAPPAPGMSKATQELRDSLLGEKRKK